MVFVTLGTQDKPFLRLLEEVEKEIDKGTINDKVIVQAGVTKFKSTKMEIFDLMPMDQFEELVSKCDLLITHGGVGSILEGLKKNKKVIAVPRLKKYKEHINDHQLQIINRFDEAGYIIGLTDLNDLGSALKKAKNFKPNKYKSNTKNMIKIVEKCINS